MLAERNIEHAPRCYEPHIQLVPFPLWQQNLRKIMTQTEWKKLRGALLEQQGLVCATCNKIETASRRLSCHEAWEYIEEGCNGIARLSGVSLVCWHCHACEHWGNTKQLVDSGCLTTRAIEDTISHFCKLNKATENEFRAHEVQAFEDWRRRSKLEWSVDYGPFEGWAVATFERDPLNRREWFPSQIKRYRGNAESTFVEIVANLQ